MDQEAEGDHEQTRAGDDEPFEPAHLVHDHAQHETRDDRGEAVQGRDARGGFDAKVERHGEDCVDVVALHVPCEIECAGDAECAPDGAVLEEVEGYQGVRSPEFPEHESWDTKDADDERGDDVGFFPFAGQAAGDGQGHQDQRKDRDEQDDADDVEGPEQADCQLARAELLEGRFVFVEGTGSACAAAHDGERDDQRQRADRVDDAPHANAPFPGRGFEDGLGNVAGHPGVDDEGQRRDVAEKQTRAERRDIGDDDFDEEDDQRVSDLIEDGPAGESRDVGGARFDDGAEGVEDDRHTNQLETAEDVGDFGTGGLCSGGDDGAEDVDGGEERVFAHICRGRRLERVPDCSVETVRVGDEEDSDEQKDTVGQGQDLADGFDASDTRRFVANQEDRVSAASFAFCWRIDLLVVGTSMVVVIIVTEWIFLISW